MVLPMTIREAVQPMCEQRDKEAAALIDIAHRCEALALSTITLRN
jgi:hypothetical protein